MSINNKYIVETMTDLIRQKESAILEQLNDLVSRNLLVVEETEPTLVRELNNDKITLQQKVKLTLKDKEYIENLEVAVAELSDQVDWYQDHHLTPLIPQIEMLLDLNGKLRDRLDKINQVVIRQARDEGLWSHAEYIGEDMLQSALRHLHAVIEDEKETEEYYSKQYGEE